MKTILNLPLVNLMPFSEVEEKRPVLLLTSLPAWNAVNARLHDLPFGIAHELKQHQP